MAALCAHAALGTILGVSPSRLLEPSVPQLPEELSIVTEDTDLAPAPEALPTSAMTTLRGASVEPGRKTRSGAPPATGGKSIVAPPGGGEAWSLPAEGLGAARIDLGIGSYWKSVAMGDAPPAEPVPLSPASSSPNHILRDGLDAHDRGLGLSAASPLVTAAHEAASPSIAPDVGSATLSIECDASGMVVGAEVVSATTDVAAWRAVGREIVRLMSAGSLHLPRDARGLRARLRIVAERVLPGGQRVPMTAGAEPDGECEGVGSRRRCVAGLPVGVSGGFELSNVGARASRRVQVKLVSEVAL